MASPGPPASVSLHPPRFQQILSHPRWCYFRLTTLSPAAPTALDINTVRLALLQALTTYLGDHGAAISTDILQIRHGPKSSDVIVRIPHQDHDAFAAALSTVGGATRAPLRVKASADWLTGLVAASPEDLFDFKHDHVSD